MLGSLADYAPPDLGSAPAPDPFGVQPGSILFARFCVIDRVRHGSLGWRVRVTDIERRLGSPPHHRLDLVLLPTSDHDEHVVRRALPAFQLGCRRIHATVPVDDGIALLVNPLEAPVLPEPLPESSLHVVARTVVGIAGALHRQGIVGIRLHPRQLRIDDEGRCQLADWTLLLDLTSQQADEEVERDLGAIEDLLHTLGVAESILHEPIRDADELLHRFDQAGHAEVMPPAEVLPAVPPFVGRRELLLAAHEVVASARHRGPEVVCVHGEPGAGKTRLLHRLALELQRGDGALPIVISDLGDGMRVLGIAAVMSALANAVDALPRSERDAIGHRIAQRLGTMSGILGFLDSRLAALVGHAAPLPRLSLDKRFVRHAAAAAQLLSAIGTARRPLLLLIDDIPRADASLRALLYHLLVPGTTHHTVVFAAGRTVGIDLPRDVRPFHLGSLETDEVVELVEACLPSPVTRPAEIAALIGRATSSPAAVWDSLQSGVRSGRIVRMDGGWQVSDDERHGSVVPMASLLRLGDLGEDARQIVTLLAVRSVPSANEWLSRVTRWPEDRVLTAIRELVIRRVVYRDIDGAVRMGAHPWRTRVLEEAGTSAIAQAHGDIARWLDNLGGEATASQRAWHSEHAAAPGPDAAIAAAHLKAGHEQLRAYDADRAQWHFDRALERHTDAAVRQQALEGRADALMLLDRSDDALSAYLAALELVDDPERVLTIANRAVSGMYLGGASRALMAVANRALQTVGQRLPTSFAEAVVQVIGALVSPLRPRLPDAVADQLCQLQLYIAGAVVTSDPHVLMSSVFRGWAAAAGRTSGAAASARSMMSVILAAIGAPRAMQRLLDRAEQQAIESDDPTALGIVSHYRGQTLLGLGLHWAGQQAMTRAVEAFQRAGDLSIAVVSMAISAFYALQRESAPELMDRLAAAEAAAFRQRNRSVLPGIRGMRVLLRARMGAVDLAGAQAVAQELDEAVQKTDLVSGVVGDAMVALAFEQLGRPFLGEAYAVRALARLDATSIRPPFLGVALVAAARVAIANITDRRSRRRAEGLVRRLRRARKTTPSLVVASHVVDAKLFVAAQNFDAAAQSLELVLSGADTHGERWYVLEAHQMLARVLTGRNAPAARAHTDLAAELERKLSPECRPAAPSDVVGPHLEVDVAIEETRIDLAVEGLERMVGRHLGDRPLVVRSGAGLRTPAHEELVQLLLVNLVLAAGDAATGDAPVRLTADQVALTEDDAARYPDATAGHWNRIRVRVDSVRGEGARGALSECGELCRRMDGFLDIGEGRHVDLSAWLPAARSVGAGRSHGLVAILSREQGVQRTLVDGIRRMGFAAQLIGPGEFLGDDVVGVFTESPLQVPLPEHVWVVDVVPRRGGWDRGRQLPMPFLVKELQAILGQHLGDRGSTASAGPPA